MVRALLEGRKTETWRLTTFIQQQDDGFWHARGNGGGMMGMHDRLHTAEGERWRDNRWVVAVCLRCAWATSMSEQGW